MTPAHPDAAELMKATVLESERLVLRALCQGALEGPVRSLARRYLASYQWLEPVHQVIFEIVMSLPTDSPQLIREQLPARLTRRGFPDADVDPMLRGPLLSRSEAEQLMRRLREP